MIAKRLFDVVMSLFGIIFLLPFFLIVAIVIKLESEGPVFFRQYRVGLLGRNFRILKFRTMSDDNLGLKITVGNDARITRVGGFLRKYKIDELPQLINVLLGDMSLVGPRPEVPEYVEHYSDFDKSVVLSVRPGITDWASIRYRDENVILASESDPVQAYVNKILPSKLRYCRFYVRTRSFCGDLKILWQTLMVVV